MQVLGVMFDMDDGCVTAGLLERRLGRKERYSSEARFRAPEKAQS